ncbi:Rid family hydrolase, partial [Streptococcus suis]
MVKTIQTDQAPKAIGPYVQGKVVGDFLFASGQVPLSPETGEIVGETIEEQTKQVLTNIKA